MALRGVSSKAKVLTLDEFKRAKQGINEALKYIEFEQEDLELIEKLIQAARQQVSK